MAVRFLLSCIRKEQSVTSSVDYHAFVKNYQYKKYRLVWKWFSKK